MLIKITHASVSPKTLRLHFNDRAGRLVNVSFNLSRGEDKKCLMRVCDAFGVAWPPSDSSEFVGRTAETTYKALGLNIEEAA